MISTPCYVAREDVMSAADVKYTAFMRAQIDEAIETGSRRVDEFTHRVFYPQVQTRSFDWPDWLSRSPSWRFWIPTGDLISVTTLTSGGIVIPPSNYDLRNGDDRPEPPYNRIEIDLSSDSTFDSGETHQRSLVVAGEWGYDHTHRTVTVSTGSMAATGTSLGVADSSVVGVGDLVEIDDEHMLCTEKSMVDTGQNTSALTASQSDQAITGITAGTLNVGETLLIDAERMLVTDVAGTTVTVRRATDGTTLATHALNADIYAPRTLTVTRGAFGTTAATHSSSASVEKVVYPPMVRQLARAYALDQLQQEGSAYARTVGSGDNERQATGRAIADLENRLLESRLVLKTLFGAV